MKKKNSAKKFHIKGREQAYLVSNLALLLKSAVPLGSALESLQKTSGSKQLSAALGQIKSDIDEGKPLWKALKHSGVVTNETLALVRLGEQSGNLAKNLELAATQEEKRQAFKARVRSALIYPSFVFGLTVIVASGVTWFLLPRLAQTFTQLRVELPLISRIFIELGLFLEKYGAWVVPLSLLGLVALIYILFVPKKTRFLGQAILYRIPGISRLMHEIEIARFGYLLGTLLDAGLTITQSLSLLYGATQSREYKKLYRYLFKRFDEGYNFQSSFKEYPGAARLIPPPVQQIIIAGEQSGSLPESLQTVGRVYDEKANTSTKNLEAILEPILLVVVWLGVLAVAIAVILPIYSLIGGISSES